MLGLKISENKKLIERLKKVLTYKNEVSEKAGKESPACRQNVRAHRHDGEPVA
jgi:hypothetical protein